VTPKFRSLPTILAVALAITTLATTFAVAAGTDSKEEPANTAESLYNEGLELAEQGRYADAREKFEAAHAEDDRDPETVNMLAFTLRKTGELEKAFALYEEALALRDRFPEAREYLGEAHLQAALQQVEILRSYGPDGAEQLESLLGAIQRAAADAAGEDFEVQPTNW